MTTQGPSKERAKGRPNLLAAAASGAFVGLATHFALHDIVHVVPQGNVDSLAVFGGVDAAVLTGAVTAGRWNRAVLPATVGLATSLFAITQGYHELATQGYGVGVLGGVAVESIGRDITRGLRRNK